MSKEFAEEVVKVFREIKIETMFQTGDLRPDFGVIDLRKGPDGVWELQE